ncbi:nucleotide exchange factor GrpE [Arthrobacter sp. EPSL27]|jgi:molecular chaperone GrpE|uniref:nucleotide exchange factor GrpE n=1 Tax=Arthrobacter sp. EPSL27 TaxID=1745378 RepID=UPI00074A8FB9|nr:nucleotide exchange factor GrpE [Arthrobacter sp. EPSL27]KUM33261.1 molecular chaperone GrpE [Arthrobacter sp. EPSL27]
MSDQAGPSGQAHQGSDEARAAARDEREAEAEAQADALAKMEDQWRRALADADNVRKRAARDGAQLRAQERAAVSLEWLPVLDNLELAVAHAPAGADDPFVEGIDSIRKQAIDTLARLGYPRIDEENVPFDPRVHEVVSVVDTDEVPPGTLVSVLRPGYGSADNTLRPAAVVVSRAVTPDRG